MLDFYVQDFFLYLINNFEDVVVFEWNLGL